MLNNATLTPAYGRDYKSAADTVAAFNSGKDFVLASVFHGSGYVSRRDFAPGDRVCLRYSKLQKVAVYTVPAEQTCPAAVPGCNPVDLFGKGGAL
jgi:hypothetical protein